MIEHGNPRAGVQVLVTVEKSLLRLLESKSRERQTAPPSRPSSSGACSLTAFINQTQLIDTYRQSHKKSRSEEVLIASKRINCF